MYQGKKQFDELQAETLRKTTNPVERHKVRTNAANQILLDESHESFNQS